jgi:hypothetical protein
LRPRYGIPSTDGAGSPLPTRFDYLLISSTWTAHLCGLGRQDVGVTGVDDGHGGATEELTASGTKLDLYYGKGTSQSFVVPPKSLKQRASSQGSRVSMSSRAFK